LSQLEVATPAVWLSVLDFISRSQPGVAIFALEAKKSRKREKNQEQEQEKEKEKEKEKEQEQEQL